VKVFFVFVFFCGGGVFNVTFTLPNADTGGGDIAGSFMLTLARALCVVNSRDYA
jgi:hypothetical protein